MFKQYQIQKYPKRKGEILKSNGIRNYPTNTHEKRNKLNLKNMHPSLKEIQTGDGEYGGIGNNETK